MSHGWNAAEGELKMKRLFLVLLACSLFGQETFQDSIFYISPSNTWNEPSVLIMQRFIYLYKVYEKECYADSTEEFQPLKCSDGLYEWYDSVRGNYYWSHKEPTFQGFINFLKRKAEK